MKSIYTVGHSTKSLDEFIALLRAYEIEMVVDVRTIPKSRHNPQFNKDTLSEALERHGIRYRHMTGLGGLRHALKESVNTAWKNPSFRGYADYMQTSEFSENVDELVRNSRENQTVIMCAEAVPWRCHRSLIGDALIVRGIAVEDILNEKSSHPHKLTPFAHVDGKRITYPLIP